MQRSKMAGDTDTQHGTVHSCLTPTSSNSTPLFSRLNYKHGTLLGGKDTLLSPASQVDHSTMYEKFSSNDSNNNNFLSGSSNGSRFEGFVPRQMSCEQYVPPSMRLPDVEENFVCGWLAAFINITVTFPINKAIFRQQLQGIGGYKAVRQLKTEGLRNLYRGLLPPLLQKTTTLSIMFGSYRKFQLSLDRSYPDVPHWVNHTMAAMLAGSFEATLAPLERIQTLMQDRTYHQRFNNTFHAAKELRAFGLREYYRGGTIIMLRNGPSNVFFFLGREFLNDCIPKLDKDSSRFAKDFICGACLGAVISTLFFPLNVVKTRMQSRVGGPFHGVWHTFHEVWLERNRSISSLFRGFHLNYTRSFISWGLINASYELLMRCFRIVKEDECS